MGSGPRLASVAAVRVARVCAAAVDDVVEDAAEVLLGLAKRPEHALAHGHRRHDHDELAHRVAAVELQHRADVDVRLARARLHLHGKVGERDRLAVHLGLDGPQRVVGRDVVALLHLLEFGQDVAAVQRELVGHGRRPIAVQLERLAGVARLALEQVHHGLDGAELVFLVGVRLEMHETPVEQVPELHLSRGRFFSFRGGFLRARRVKLTTEKLRQHLAAIT